MLRGMLPVNTDTLRLFLHVLAATVWVGGQLTLAGLVPGLRALGPDVPRTVVRRFNRIAWPAFGLWNLSETNFGQQTTAWQATLFAKLVIVALAGVSAALHTHASSRKAVAIWGALSGLTSLLALFYGVQLHG
jgi:putative copper export protein